MMTDLLENYTANMWFLLIELVGAMALILWQTMPNW